MLARAFGWLLTSPPGWERTEEQVEELLLSARRQAKSRLERLITDGLHAYEHGRVWALGWRRCEHERHVSWRDGKALMNLIERKIQMTRVRTRTIGGLRRIESGQEWFEGLRAHYNFVRDHMALGTTPARAAGLNLPLGRNRWLGLIKLSV